ncbi:MAG: LysR family transcriptional regulator [Proteobacteria bacterium]|nr:LysR family transcriptional regulator [Pseudomonadota bacterium]MBS0574276.1 LysR family transcriptional regulator [Pseudomonadota bacterium]
MPDLPLNALRAFEAAARAASFTLAAAELGVTSAAVSQQVRALEGHYGKKLFLRQGNRITLTDAGRAIYPRLEAALAEIAAIGAALRDEQGRARLVVSCLPSVAESWLIPHLAGFGPAPGIELRVEDDPVVLARAGVDLRITYGGYLYPDHRCEPLFRDRIVALAAPGLAPEGLAALPDSRFVHTDWGQSFVTAPSWAAYWRQAGGRAAPDPARGLVVGQSHLAIVAARAGLGAALAPERIAASAIGSGALRIVGGQSLPMQHDYVLVWPHAASRRRDLAALVAHLRGTG